MEQAQTPKRSAPHENALDALTIYLTEHTRMTEPEARNEARSMLRTASATENFDVEASERPWWSLILRGLLAIMFGWLFLTRPLSALTTLVFVFGAWAFVDGVVMLAAAVAERRSWKHALSGLLGIAIGGFIIMSPGVSLLLFSVLMAAWVMARGIGEIASSTRPTSDTTTHAPSKAPIALGVISFFFGLFLLAVPPFGLAILALSIGVYAIIFGIALVVEAIPMRRAQRAAVAH